MSKTLTIIVSFSNGVEMEYNLNKAIDEFSSVLKKKGLMNMILEGKKADSWEAMYKVEITENNTQTVENHDS